jgi:hypothetical protein
MRRSFRLLCATLVACGSFAGGAAAPAAEPPAAAPAAAPTPPANLAASPRWVISADFLRDGSRIVTAGGESLLYRPGDVVIWKADGSREADLPGHPTAVWAVRVSKDGKVAATAGYDGLVKLWDLGEKKLKHDLKKHKGWVRALDISPDGTKLATAGEDGTVVLWNTADGAEIKQITAHGGPVTAIAFAPDGNTIATGGGDKLVKLWETATGNEKGKLEGHGEALWAVAYAPDGSKLATAGADRTIKLWTTADSKEFATLSGHKDWVTSLGFSPDGARLVSGSLDGAVKLWDVAAKGQQEGPEAMKSSVWCVQFAPDGKNIFVGTHAGGKLVATPAPKLLPPPPPPPPPSPPPPTLVEKATPLVPTEFKSAAGATAKIAADGIVLVEGNRAKDTYTLKAVVPAGVEPKAIRLDVLPDPSLPAMGPGRSDGGNFVVSRFAVSSGAPGAADTPTAAKFAGAKADFEQEGYAVAGAIDDNPETGWAIAGGIGKEHNAVFTLAPDVKIAAGAPLLVTIDQQFPDGQHGLGKFRLSIVHMAAQPAAAPPPPAAPAK